MPIYAKLGPFSVQVGFLTYFLINIKMVELGRDAPPNEKLIQPFDIIK